MSDWQPDDLRVNEPMFDAYYRITGNIPAASDYQYSREQVPHVVARLLALGCPNIVIQWTMRDHNRPEPTKSQEAALADIRNKYADDPEVVRDFEILLGISEPKGINE